MRGGWQRSTWLKGEGIYFTYWNREQLTVKNANAYGWRMKILSKNDAFHISYERGGPVVDQLQRGCRTECNWDISVVVAYRNYNEVGGSTETFLIRLCTR